MGHRAQITFLARMRGLRMLWTGRSDTPIQPRALVSRDCRRIRQLAVSISSLPLRPVVIINSPYPTTAASLSRLEILKNDIFLLRNKKTSFFMENTEKEIEFIFLGIHS